MIHCCDDRPMGWDTYGNTFMTEATTIVADLSYDHTNNTPFHKFGSNLTAKISFIMVAAAYDCCKTGKGHVLKINKVLFLWTQHIKLTVLSCPTLCNGTVVENCPLQFK